MRPQPTPRIVCLPASWTGSPRRHVARGASHVGARSFLLARRRVLITAIATLVASNASGGSSDDVVLRDSPDRYFVSNCDDHGPGSLRDTLASATEGGVVDLTQLTCSTITLTTGPLVSSLDDITIAGNATISSAGSSRVLSHYGTGTLGLIGITLADGAVTSDWIAVGGCLYSLGNISALSTVVRNCTASSSTIYPGYVLGAGIYAAGSVSLSDSSVLDNTILLNHASDIGRGGGVSTGADLLMSRSTISGNAVIGDIEPNQGLNAAGGFYAASNIYVAYSTVSGNSAYFAGGGWFGSAEVSKVVNSTISENRAQSGAGGLVSLDSLLEVWNSTIAFNRVDSLQQGEGILSCGGLVAFGDNEYISLRSSIVADNALNGVASDLCATRYIASVIGYGNLIIASDQALPSDTLRADPMLASLADNGGTTRTHALLPGSPAIDAGNNSISLDHDQRGLARVVGPRADIGAFEVQPDVIFEAGFE